MVIIRQAIIAEKDIIVGIVQNTIREVYPHYYPSGAVSLFLSYQTEENINKDIVDGNVYVIEINKKIVGTGTIKSNRICRLIISTTEQGKGYGSKIIDCLESEILLNNSSILLEASLPACELYRKRGYKTIEYKKVMAENKDFICYPVMMLNDKKQLNYNKYKRLCKL